MPSYKLFLFGAPRLEQDGQALPLPGRKLPALLVYLAATAQPHSRDRLATLFWPEFDQSSARANLRRELSGLRTIFDPTYLKIEREQVSLPLGSDLWLDIALFQSRLHECQQHPHGTQEVCAACLPLLQEVADLYTADFLAGFTLSACPAFDEWQYFQAEGYRRTLVTVLDRLAQGYLRQNQPEAAIAQARRRLTLDPLDEAAQRQLITLYAETGNRTAALRQADLCVQLLQAELGAPPDAETAALIERIRHSSATPARKANQPESRSRRAVYHNLPTQTTTFIGRAAELAEIKQLLLAETGCRLLNLVGPGGIGKTRLALAAAVQLQEAFPDGACFVALASVSDVEFIVPAIAEALRFSFHGQTTPKDQLLDHLQRKRLLLIVDNFEHLLASVDLFSAILHHAPEITILVTARERLNLQEEWVYTVEGLSIPAAAAMTAMLPIGEYSAVALFIQRARQVVNRFSPTPAEMAEIVRICQLVEGMPLGLELAAPWVRTLSCREIAQEIQQNLDFLTTSLRNLPERHRSLRAVLAQSWQRVTLAEQTILQGLSVFRGGCTREAAEQVTGATLPILSSLVDKALLRRTASGRYELHELIRQFAQAQLQTDPAASEQRQHADYFLKLAEEGQQKANGPEQRLWLDRLEAELGNLRAALAWSKAEASRIEVGLLLAAKLYFIWNRRGHMSEGRAWLTELLARPESSSYPAARVGALRVAGTLAIRQGDHAVARPLLEESMALGQTFEEDKRDLAFALFHLGDLERDQNNYERATALYEESLALCRATKFQFGIAVNLWALGNIALLQSDLAKATALFEEGLALQRALGNQHGIGHVLNALGRTAQQQGKYQQAQALYEESLASYRELGNNPIISWILIELGDVALAQGEYEQAKTLYKESLKLSQKLGLKINLAESVIGLAGVASQVGQSEQAARLFGTAQRLLDSLGTQLDPLLRTAYEQNLAAVRAQISEEAFATAWAKGQAMTLEQAVKYALLTAQM